MIGCSHQMNLWSITWPWWVCRQERRTKWELLPRMEMGSKQLQSGLSSTLQELVSSDFNVIPNFPQSSVLCSKRSGGLGCPYPEICWLGCIEVGDKMKVIWRSWGVRWRSGDWTPSTPSNSSTVNHITYYPYFACCILYIYDAFL